MTKVKKVRFSFEDKIPLVERVELLINFCRQIRVSDDTADTGALTVMGEDLLDRNTALGALLTHTKPVYSGGVESLFDVHFPGIIPEGSFYQTMIFNPEYDEFYK